MNHAIVPLMNKISLLAEAAPGTGAIPPAGWTAIGGAFFLFLAKAITPWLVRKMESEEKTRLQDAEAKNQRLAQADSDKAQRLKAAEETSATQAKEIMELAISNARLEQAHEGLLQRFEKSELERAELLKIVRSKLEED